MNNSYLEQSYDLARKLNAAPDITAILDTVADHFPRVIKARYCSLFLRNPASRDLEIKAHNHPDIGEDPFIQVGSKEESIMNLTLNRGTSMIIQDVEDEIGHSTRDKYQSNSCMCILIKHEDNILGVFNLADKTTGSFTKDDMLMASIVGELLGALLSRRATPPL